MELPGSPVFLTERLGAQSGREHTAQVVVKLLAGRTKVFVVLTGGPAADAVLSVARDTSVQG